MAFLAASGNPAGVAPARPVSFVEATFLVDAESRLKAPHVRPARRAHHGQNRLSCLGIVTSSRPNNGGPIPYAASRWVFQQGKLLPVTLWLSSRHLPNEFGPGSANTRFQDDPAGLSQQAPGAEIGISRIIDFSRNNTSWLWWPWSLWRCIAGWGGDVPPASGWPLPT